MRNNWNKIKISNYWDKMKILRNNEENKESIFISQKIPRFFINKNKYLIKN